MCFHVKTPNKSAKLKMNAPQKQKLFHFGYFYKLMIPKGNFNLIYRTLTFAPEQHNYLSQNEASP
jgi:hypothetical protein